MNKRKIIIAIIFAIIAIVGALIYQIYTAIDRSGKIPVEVAAAPNDAKITFKDKKTKVEYAARNGTNYLPPGDYSITAAKDGFRSSQTEVNANSKPQHIIIIELMPQSDQARQWQKKHMDQYNKVEGIAGQQIRETGKKFTEEYPVVAKLPIKDSYYSVGYYKKDDRPIIVIRTESPQYRYKATLRLVSMGIKLSDYQIEYADYKSHLGE
ncbi:carboxypeptidase regulatory-like domain-containing protein [Candidatus Saccharibacteria bacterium]|nr:carboxypeptidase regulatory-like domain-containing protein [Candidatus Saccharibacteria bacterium]